MKKDNQPSEQKLGTTRQSSDHTSVRKNIDPLQKKEIKPEDKKLSSGNTQESHSKEDE